MKRYITIETTTRKIQSITCNMCGNDIKKNEHGYFEDYLSMEKEWGYGSRHDGEHHCIDLCQACYQKLLTQFKVSPIQKEGAEPFL